MRTGRTDDGNLQNKKPKESQKSVHVNITLPLSQIMRSEQVRVGPDRQGQVTTWSNAPRIPEPRTLKHRRTQSEQENGSATEK